MFRTKDFILMDVCNTKGKKIGFIKDILIDFNRGEVKGFAISSYKLFQGTICVLKENIVSFNKTMVISKYNSNKYFKFSDMRSMDIINKSGDIVGMMEDILFHEFTFKIYGVIVSTGFVKNLISGKKVFLIKNMILGEESILYYKDNSKIDLISIPHKLFTEVGQHEKSI